METETVKTKEFHVEITQFKGVGTMKPSPLTLQELDTAVRAAFDGKNPDEIAALLGRKLLVRDIDAIRKEVNREIRLDDLGYRYDCACGRTP